MCWTFLGDLRIPLTNNAAERALRPYVIWRKLSYASQSYRGDQFRAMILSVVATARNLGPGVGEVLRRFACEYQLHGEVGSRLPLDHQRLLQAP